MSDDSDDTVEITWSANSVVQNMMKEKDGKQLVHEMFLEMANQLKECTGINSGAPVGVLITSDDIVVLKFAGDNRLFIVCGVDPASEEFEFVESIDEDENVRYNRELSNQLGIADGVAAGTLQDYKR